MNNKQDCEKEYAGLIDVLTKFKREQEVFYVCNECKVHLVSYVGYDHFSESYALADNSCYETEIVYACREACFHTQHEADLYALRVKRERLAREIAGLDKQIQTMEEKYE